MSVEFRALGPLEVVVDGQSLPLHGSKHRIVLGSLLIADRHRVSVHAMIEAVWGEDPPATATKQVRNAISDLRGLLHTSGATVTAVGDGYHLHLGGAHLDLETFQRQVTHARELAAAGEPIDAVAAFRRALGHWRGPVLAGLESRQLQAHSAALQEERLAAFHTCVGIELSLGRHCELLRELPRWVEENPLREQLAAQLIIALHRSGARDRALATYDHTRRRLADVLGLDPGPELQELHRQLLAGRQIIETRQGGLARSNLPPDPKQLTGRSEVLASVLRHGRQVAGSHGASTEQTVLIDGMAGIGKSTVAIHASHHLRESFPDGQFYLNLRAHSPDGQPVELAEALEVLLRLVGATPEETQGSAEQLAASWRLAMDRRRVLLVLDDADSAQLVSLLTPDSPSCLTIVTSRRRLTALPAAKVFSLDVPPLAEARLLFQRLTPDRTGSYEQRLCDLILEQCGRLPLAISIVAARLRHRPMWSMEFLASRLADPRRRLLELRSQERSVAECFAFSYHRLDSDQRYVLGLMAAVPEDEVTAESVAAIAGLPLWHVETLLEGLTDEHLLQQPSPERYRMHILLKIYSPQNESNLAGCASPPVRLPAPTRVFGATPRARQFYDADNSAV
jgi:DNA-binding SARP family transcriptional activator